MEEMVENTVSITQAEYEEYQKLREAPDYREKYAAVAHGINPELTDDALTLAKLRVNEECDLDSALEAVLTVYPHMKAGYVQAVQNAPLSTGMKTGGKPAAVSGVEAAFMKKNPGIKL
jgi:hypothetical protein